VRFRRESLFYHIPLRLGEAHVASCVAKGGPGVGEAGQVENGGVPVVDLYGGEQAFVTPCIGLAMAVARLDSAPANQVL
jgi:hypothetical protein